MKDEPVPVARVMSLPPERPHGDAAPDGFVVPLYGLYSPGQVAFATFFGTPFAGCWLLARNYKRLGQPGAGWLCLGLGAFVVLAMLGLAFAEMLPGMSSFATIPVMLLVARALQGSTFDRHTSLGGKRKSSWIAFGTAMACLGGVFVIAIGAGVIWAITTEAPSIEPAPGSDVRYVDGATESDARRLGTWLVEKSYFENPATVQVHRETGRVVVTFVVQAIAVMDTKYHDAYAGFAEDLATKAFAGTPVDIVLADDELEPKRRLRWEVRPRTLTIDTNHVRFRDGIEEHEARAVMRIMGERRFLTTDTTVSLGRSGRLVMTLHVVSDIDQRPLLKTMMHNLAHPISRVFGGSPIDIKLDDVEDRTLATLTWEKRPPESIAVATGGEVMYRDGGTLEEAEGIARTLANYFEREDSLSTVIVMRDGPRAVVAFYSAVTDDPDLDKEMAAMAEPLSLAVFAKQPVDIRLIESDLTAHATFPWEKRRNGKRPNAGAIRPTR